MTINEDKTSGKIRVSGLLRIYWNINTPIQIKSGQSIPLGLYPKSLPIHEEYFVTEKRSALDDTVLTKLSLIDENDLTNSSIANLRRVQTIRVSSSQRRPYRISLPQLNPTATDDDEVKERIESIDR